MKKIHKNILGVICLAFVLAMTIFAYTLPEPEVEIVSRPSGIARAE